MKSNLKTHIKLNFKYFSDIDISIWFQFASVFLTYQGGETLKPQTCTCHSIWVARRAYDCVFKSICSELVDDASDPAHGDSVFLFILCKSFDRNIIKISVPVASLKLWSWVLSR